MPSPAGAKVKLKNEQQPVSRSVSSRAAACAPASSTSNNLIASRHSTARSAVANNWSNSATRNGHSTVGNVQADDTQSSFALIPDAEPVPEYRMQVPNDLIPW
ncbi:hypothetical protein GCM10010522_49970 [Kribbella solani]